MQHANSKPTRYVCPVCPRPPRPVIGSARAHGDGQVLVQPVPNTLGFLRCLESALTTPVRCEWNLSWSRGVEIYSDMTGGEGIM